jgi:hypothetical protein
VKFEIERELVVEVTLEIGFEVVELDETALDSFLDWVTDEGFEDLALLDVFADEVFSLEIIEVVISELSIREVVSVVEETSFDIVKEEFEF